ncbi:MAG: hypothetical protein H0T42_09940 [Deltaproteobacteria bacterium]|nr:hypothetical protein [Deltaproteobacteria bacterium]
MMIRLLLASAFALAACGGNESDELGVGAQCTATDECNQDISATCLLQFKGGYCGLTGCLHDTDCPESSACVKHTDNVNYCFRICLDKPECNANRDGENEANCSGSATFVDGTMGRKACLPPSG